MGKILTFKDKSDITLTDLSSIFDCVTVLSSFAEVDDIRSKFTEANLKSATFNGESIKNIIPVSTSASADPDGNVTVHFYNREKTHDEIVDEQLLELQSAMADIMV